MKSSVVYNWSFKRCSVILIIEPELWITSFVVALSRKQVKWILSLNTSKKSEMFKWVIKDVANLIEKEDNRGKYFYLSWTIHKFIEAMSKETSWRNKKIKQITIPPYSPQLNFVEKLIGLIKGRVRKSWLRYKPLNLNLLKEIIDGISIDSLEKYIKSLREEALKKMKILKILR